MASMGSYLASGKGWGESASAKLASAITLTDAATEADMVGAWEDFSEDESELSSEGEAETRARRTPRMPPRGSPRITRASMGRMI